MLALVLAACGEGNEASRVTTALPEPQPAPSSTNPAAEAPPGCTASPIETVLDDARARLGLATRAGWLVALDDEGAFARSPDGERYPIQAPLRRLLGLEQLDARPVLLGIGTCDTAAHCLIALDPSQSIAAVTRPLTAPVTTTRRAALAHSVYLAWSAADGSYGLERWSSDPPDLRHVSIPLGDESADAEAPVEVLGLTATDEQWALIWRRGPIEDSRSHVFVSTSDHRRSSEALHEALTVESMTIHRNEVMLIAGHEFARPGLIRVGPQTERRVLIGPNDTIPPPLAHRDRAELERDEDSLWLARRDAAGDALGGRTQVAGESVDTATVERVEDGFAVTWASGPHIRRRTLRCSGERQRSEPRPREAGSDSE